MKSLVLLAAFCSLLLFTEKTTRAQQASPYPAAIAAWDETTKQKQREAGDKLLLEIRAASDAGRKIFTVPTAHYRFHKTTKQGSRQVFILLTKLNDFVIDGNGSTFWFEDDHQAFYFGGCRNVTVKNMYLDWDPLPFTQGTIVGLTPQSKSLSVRLDAGYERVTPHFASIPADKHEPNVRAAIFEPQINRFKKGQNGFRVMPFLGNRQADGTYPVKVLPFYERDLSSVNAAVGDRIAFWIRGEGAFLIETSENVVLENITLYSCGGFAFRDAAGKGPVTYRRCHILPRPGTNRLLGGNSDGFHSANMEIGPLIEECEVQSIGDDGVNVHGFFYNVMHQESPTTLITEPIAWRGDLQNVTLDFYHKGDMAPLGRRIGATVKSITWNGKAARRVELTQPISVAEGDTFSCDNYVGQGAIIRNNSFTNIWPRGILFRSHNARIENNRFNWIGSYALALMPQPGFWRESAYIHDLLVANNTIHDSDVFFGGSGRNVPHAAILLSAPGYEKGARQKNVQLRNNTILRPGGAGIIAQGVENLQISGNRISQHGNLSDGYGIELDTVTGLSLENNHISEPGARAKGDIQQK